MLRVAALALSLLLAAGCSGGQTATEPNQAQPGLRLIDVKVHSTMTMCGSPDSCHAYALIEPPGVDRGEALLKDLSPTYPFYLIWVGKNATTDYLARFRVTEITTASGADIETTVARCQASFDPREAQDAVMVHIYVVFESTACRITAITYTTEFADPSGKPATP